MNKELVELLYGDKIKKLLDKFLEPDFELKADTYLNIFLSHLSGKDDKELGESLIELKIFTEWLFNCIQIWENGGPFPSANIISLVFNIASLLSKDETRFNLFNSYNTYTRLCVCTKIKENGISPLVQLAYIKLLTSFLQHKSGTNWLIASNNWMEILNFCLKGQTIYIVREGQSFMYQLLLAASQCNEVFCNIVVTKIMFIIKQTQLTNNSAIVEINGETLQEELMPSLRLIAYILESYLQSEGFSKQEYKLPQIFVNHLKLEQTFWNSILTGIKSQDLVYELNKVMILNNFFKVAIECESPFYEDKQNQEMIAFILELIKQLVVKFDVINILKISHISQYYWSFITTRVEKILQNRDRLPSIFDQQVLIFQILPIIAISYKYCDFNMEAATETYSPRDVFISKLFITWCTDTIRWVYNFRARLETDSKNLFDIAQKSFLYVMKSRPYLHREPAVIAFQFFIYILKDITRIITEKPEIIDVFMKNTGYMVTHLDAIAVFMLEYDITWRDSVETISIMSILMKLLNVPHWPPRVITQMLKLLNLSIARFTTPNLALLIDRTSDSEMANLGPVLIAKLFDTSWEVRDSALEVLHTICTVAHTKFPSFQSLILEHELPLLVVTMGLNDGEAFVRASALKCLKEMIQVQDVWEAVLQQQSLCEKMLQILYNETEAIVRCEAASVVCAIYEHQLIEWSLIESINQVLVYSATSDLHWEVKLSALCYWNLVIDNRLSHQGMIDGDFPDVTFSGEQRKIVTLTIEEVKTRLKKVLRELSECGCLSVLMTAVQDECDIEVSKKALEIIKKLSTLLDKYNVTFTDTDVSQVSPQNVADNSLFLEHNLSNVPVSDNVIDEIVNSRDMQLLPHVYLQDSNDSSTKTFPVSSVQPVTAQHFFNFIKKDLEGLIRERKNWLNNIDDLSSLLDDMLKNYDICDDTNVMDCY